MSAYTEDHLVEQPAIQLMQHELGWDVMSCFGEPSSQELRRSGWEVPGKTEMLKQGAVEEMGIFPNKAASGCGIDLLAGQIFGCSSRT